MAEQIQQSKHTFIRADRGGVFLTHGEYDDNLEEDYVCIKCGRYLSEIEQEVKDKIITIPDKIKPF